MTKPETRQSSLRRDRRSQATYSAYNALTTPLLPALAAYTLWRRYGQGKSAASLRGQWGFVPQEVAAALHSDADTQRLWIHAVSVGETLAVRPVARALKVHLPDCRIALSVTTDTGHETAQGALRAGEVDAVFYFPLDTPLTVQRVLRVVRPHAFLVIETELWPNVLHLARRMGARTFLVNGRVSDRLLLRAPKMGRIWRWMMGNLDGLLMRSQFDAERIKSLGAPRDRVVVTGDVKLDAVPDDAQNADARTHWRELLAIPHDAPLWVAGSTHAGEEAAVLRVHQRLRTVLPQLRLVLAPRHIERVEEIVALAQEMNVPLARRTQLDLTQQEDVEAPVILLDTVGELAQLYAACDVAFVGGSLIERGGHNMLEPVLRGAPVLFGPFVMNFRDAAAFVEKAEVGRMVHNEDELHDALHFWLTDEAERRTATKRARKMLEEHSGAARRVAEIVAGALREESGES